MKVLMTIQSILFCAALAWGAWALHGAAGAMNKASEDFRDAWQRFYAQEVRTNYELDQLAKDRIRLRELMKKMEGRHGKPADKPQPR